MSHCINAYICKLEDLKIPKEIKYKELPQGFIIFDTLPSRFYKEDDDDYFELVAPITEISDKIVLVETDYFGGAGTQNAKLWINGRRIKLKDKWNPINEALIRLGVVKNNNFDEFDTIHLGNFRSNEDLELE